MKRLAAAVLALGCIPLAASVSYPHPNSGPGFRSPDWDSVDAVFAAYDHTDTPGCALGVVQDGDLVYARGYGMANLDHGIAITPQTVFRTGSVAKQFTAAAIAIAAREGAISLDDPVNKWIPTLPTYPSDPTIRHMVHHVSGLRDYLVLMALKGLRDDDFYTDAQVRNVLSRQRELNFAPGAEYLYSNSGYFLLGQIIREATGMSLREYAQGKIFEPLGMRHSHFHDDHNHIVPNRATGYAPEGDGYRISVTTLDMVGDGGVFTSIEDLVQWVNALNYDTLDEGLTAMLETRGILTTGDTIRYAFGQTHGQYRGLRTVGHGGAFVGFRADITRFPDRDTSFLTICNRSDVRTGQLARRVADVVLADYLGSRPAVQNRSDSAPTPTPDPGPVTNVDDYVGSYYSPELDVEYTLSRSEEALRLRVGQGIDGELRRIEEDVLVLRRLTFRFTRENGLVTGFEVDAGRVQHVAFMREESG
jgi:CubicO group peptidase (beta-lactamase class C family)